MKLLLYDILIWISGADREIIDKCSKSEHIKHAGYGVLILIPAILGALSMSYALSTFIPNERIYISLGLLWGIIVLFIDRFLVSNLTKSRYVAFDFLSFKFFIRLVFAGCIGLVVSHPLVMLFFNDAIDNRLAKARIETYDALRINTKEKIESIESKKQLQKIQDELQCYQRLLSAEYSGREEALDCGFSSGLPHCGDRCKLIQNKIEKLESSIETTKKQVQSESNRILKQSSIDSSNLKFNEDYITRYNTLCIIREEHKPHIKIIELFLILFFILIDIIPVLFKVSSVRSEYDDLLEKRRHNKIQSFQIESEKDLAIEEQLVEQLFTYKTMQINEIFQSQTRNPIKDLLQELKEKLGIVFDNSTIGLEKKINPIEKDLNKRKPRLVFYYLLDNPLIFLLFVTIVLFIQYLYLNNIFSDDKERLYIVLPMTISASVTLITSIFPLLKKS